MVHKNKPTSVICKTLENSAVYSGTSICFINVLVYFELHLHQVPTQDLYDLWIFLILHHIIHIFLNTNIYLITTEEDIHMNQVNNKLQNYPLSTRTLASCDTTNNMPHCGNHLQGNCPVCDYGIDIDYYIWYVFHW